MRKESKKILHRRIKKKTYKSGRPTGPMLSPPVQMSSMPGFQQIMMELPRESLPTSITSQYKDTSAVDTGNVLPSINNRGDSTQTIGLLRKQFQIAPS